MIVLSRSSGWKPPLFLKGGRSEPDLAIESPKESREQTAVRWGRERSRNSVAQVRPGSAIPPTTQVRQLDTARGNGIRDVFARCRTRVTAVVATPFAGKRSACPTV